MAPFSLLGLPAHGVTQEPHTSVRSEKKVYLVAREIETVQKQLGDRPDAVERKSDAQLFIGEELLDDYSNSCS
jgi:hypothetical protein